MSLARRLLAALLLGAGFASQALSQTSIRLQPLGCPLAPPTGAQPLSGTGLGPLSPSLAPVLPAVAPGLGIASPLAAVPAVAAPAAAVQKAAVPAASAVARAAAPARAGKSFFGVPAFLSAMFSRTEIPQPKAVDVPEVAGSGVQGRAGVQAVRPSRPGYESHLYEPYAVLPSGKPLAPDSYEGGYYGTHVAPEEVVGDRGFRARGPLEDWRLQEHTEESSQPSSAFRGATPFVSAPGADQGAAYWADEGGWVYEVRGVPTWDVNSGLEGQVLLPDGTYRGNLMRGEAEKAVPAQIPIECIPRWGRVSASSSGMLYVPASGWTPNPAYDAAVCAQFFSLAASG